MKTTCLLTIVLLALALGCGSDDDTATPTTPTVPVDPPDPPQYLGFHDVGEDYVLLGWTTPTLPAPEVLVQGRIQGEETWLDLAERIPGATTYLASTEPSTTYEFRVAARLYDQVSAWTEPQIITTLAHRYWEVTGGIYTEMDGDQCVFFDFGSANLFRGEGHLSIDGPGLWNQGQLYQDDLTGQTGVDLLNRPPVSGTYVLGFTSSSGRRFHAEVDLDATFTIPPPDVEIQQVIDLPSTLVWNCEQADRAQLTWGNLGMKIRLDIELSGTLNADQYRAAPPYILAVTGLRDPVDPQSDDPLERQAAKSTSGWIFYR